MKLNRSFATVLLGLTLCFSLAAAAQTVVGFLTLPETGVALPIPNGYGGMNWGNFNYITEQLRSGPRNVALPAFSSGGLRLCRRPSPANRFRCLACRWLDRVQHHPDLACVQPRSVCWVAELSAGAVLTPIRVPGEWGAITQATFVCRDSQQRAAIFKLWSVTLQ